MFFCGQDTSCKGDKYVVVYDRNEDRDNERIGADTDEDNNFASLCFLEWYSVRDESSDGDKGGGNEEEEEEEEIDSSPRNFNVGQHDLPVFEDLITTDFGRYEGCIQVLPVPKKGQTGVKIRIRGGQSGPATYKSKLAWALQMKKVCLF